MLLQSFSNVWLWSVFALNRDYIARNECVNRFNEKALSCRGQCILMKKMREHEEKEQKNLESRIIDVVFIDNSHNFSFDMSSICNEDYISLSYPEYKQDYSYNPTFTIFHPPLV